MTDKEKLRNIKKEQEKKLVEKMAIMQNERKGDIISH